VDQQAPAWWIVWIAVVTEAAMAVGKNKFIIYRSAPVIKKKPAELFS